MGPPNSADIMSGVRPRWEPAPGAARVEEVVSRSCWSLSVICCCSLLFWSLVEFLMLHFRRLFRFGSILFGFGVFCFGFGFLLLNSRDAMLRCWNLLVGW